MEQEEEEQQPPSRNKPRRSQDKAAATAPKRAASTKKRKTKEEAAPKDEEEDAEGDSYVPTSPTGVEDEPELDSDGEPVRRAKNGRKLPKKKAKKERVYVIPDVERRDFAQEFRPDSTDSWSSREARKGGFTGRLGYACLNTVLRSQDPPIFSSRTARIKTIEEKGLDFVKDLARENARAIIPMIEWNVANNIRFMRLSSEIFPFASHLKYGYSPECAKDELAAAGEVARRLNHRVTMHPGQFCQLGSPNEDVVHASILELSVHAAVLDLMGMDQDSVMIIHGGGVYQDREGTLERMRTTIRDKLPKNVRDRLVLENDEMSWSAEELLPICHEFKIPMVFDFHHDMLRPSAKSPRELLPEILDLFRQRGIKPKFHLSHPRPGSRNLRERRAHSDRCGSLPLDLPPDADLMIEAKDKEQAVFELYRVYGLYDVEHSVLRPPADDITTATSGKRKTLNGSGGQSQDANGDEDGEPAKPRKRPETDDDKVKRAIEHAKKIAAKKGVPYTGPEYLDQAEARANAGPVKSTFQVMEIMEREADEIRSELKRPGGRQRALSEIRDDVEDRVEGVDREGKAKTATARARSRSRSRSASPSGVPPQEQMQDPVEHDVPGEEEKVPYEPVTPVKKTAKGGKGGAKGRASGAAAANGNAANGDGTAAHTVIVPTSAENVERHL